MTTTDILPFVRAWASHPLRVAAILPSGEALARLITRDIGPHTGPVLELGPGTGVFTRALLARGVAESDLTLIEFGGEFAQLLQRRFPEAQVLHMDASRLHRCAALDGLCAGAAVSGLPLLSLPARRVMAILRGVFDCLDEGAALYQFTYGPRCPVPRRILDRLGLRAVRQGTVLRNMPPASVYRISRRAPVPGARAADSQD